MAFICFGQIDKKLIFIIFITTLSTLELILRSGDSVKNLNSILISLEEEIGPIIARVIVYFIFKPEKEENENRKGFKYIIFLFLLKAVKSSYEVIYYYYIDEDVYNYKNILNTLNGVAIILMTFGTFLLLKYKYYIHHYICMIIYCILGIVTDIIIGSYFSLNYKYIYIYIIYVLDEVLLICYLKYMIDKLYYHYIEIVLYWGISGLFVKFIIYFSISIYEYINDIDGILNGIYIYFTETNIFIIIFYQFFYFLSYYGIYYLLLILMIFYLKPNHTIITDELYVFIRLFFYKDKPNKFYTLIPFAFQILALLFYFEILEFNFCNLNRNTIKNIENRERKEKEKRKSFPSRIDLNNQYYIVDDDLATINDEPESENNFKSDKNALLDENSIN